MNLWIINHHALTPDMGGGTRHFDFAKELIQRGHSVTIMASSFHYSKYKEMKKYENLPYIIESIEGVNFIWIKTPAYFGNGANRVRNMLSFTRQLLWLVPKLELQKPDVILGSSVHLFAVWAAYRLSKRYHTPFIMEVRDLWPQTLIDMGISKWHPFILLLGYLERYLYKRADKIISNLPYAYDYIGKYVHQEKFVWISNGVDLSRVSYISKSKSEKFVISYTGALGVANNLHTLVEVSKRLAHKKDIYFRIVGDGVLKKEISDFVVQNGLTNVSLEDSVDKTSAIEIMQQSDILYLSLIDSPLYRYGISMNKLFDYMAAGRVIIFAANPRNNPIKEANAGYTIEPNNANALEDAILDSYSMTQETRDEIGQKIRQFVVANYSIASLTDKLERLLIETRSEYA